GHAGRGLRGEPALVPGQRRPGCHLHPPLVGPRIPAPRPRRALLWQRRGEDDEDAALGQALDLAAQLREVELAHEAERLALHGGPRLLEVWPTAELAHHGWQDGLRRLLAHEPPDQAGVQWHLGYTPGLHPQAGAHRLAQRGPQRQREWPVEQGVEVVWQWR